MLTDLPKDLRYHNLFMRTAVLSSEMSFAKRSKVGAILVKDNRIVVNAWNGIPSGWTGSNICESDDNVTLPEVTHAEQNCIAFAAKNGLNTTGCDLYITLSPCHYCALLLLQSGIKSVYYLNDYRIRDGLNLLIKGGITVKQLKEEVKNGSITYTWA
jgi:dCMP deaminase